MTEDGEGDLRVPATFRDDENRVSFFFFDSTSFSRVSPTRRN